MANDNISHPSTGRKSEIVRRFNKSNPCPVCQSGTKGCSETANELFLCRGITSPPNGFLDCGPANGDPQFKCYRRKDVFVSKAIHQSNEPTLLAWEKQAKQFQRDLTASHVKELSQKLGGIPEDALHEVGIGFMPSGEWHCWTFPEYDGNLHTIGILRRFPDGSKYQMKGGSRGLSIPVSWQHREGPIFIVEGPTDVAAMTAAGLSAIGRPSNTGGVNHLITLLKTIDKKREICVIAENDRKPDDLWPGRSGAIQVATELAKTVPNPISWALVPDGKKDVRDWLIHSSGNWSDRGKVLRCALEKDRSIIESSIIPMAIPERKVDPYRPFPIETLPYPLNKLVTEGAIAIGCDQAFLALPLLAAIASLIGNSRYVRLKDGWEEPSVIWAATIADSGSHKSPAFKTVMRPFYAQQDRFKQLFDQEWAEYQESLESWKTTDKETRDEKPKAPKERRLFVSDITIERLTEILEDNPRGTLMARDEFSGWLYSFTRYKGKNGGTDVSNWLEMHCAGTVVYDRKNGDRRSIFVAEACVSITGTIQPQILATAISPELKASGLYPRLLIVMPPGKKKKWTEMVIDPSTIHAYEKLIQQLINLEGKEILPLTPEAKELWVTFFDDWAEEQYNANGELRAAFSKLEAYAPRFALIHHIIKMCAEGRPTTTPITAESMAAGIKLAKWFGNETRRVYAIQSETDQERETRELVEWIAEKGGQVTVRQLHRSNQKKFTSSLLAEEALQKLVNGGWGTWKEIPTTSKGGNPTKEFVLSVTSDRTDRTPVDNVIPVFDDREHPNPDWVTQPAESSQIPAEIDGSVGSVTPSCSPKSVNESGCSSTSELSGSVTTPSSTDEWQEGEI